MDLVTNYYESKYTRVLKDDLQIISGGNGLSEEGKKALATHKSETKARAISLLLGQKPKVIKNSNRPRVSIDLYNNYSASGKYIQVKYSHHEITVDNSGPCTSNTSLDASIDVAGYIKKAQERNDESISNAGPLFTSDNAKVMESVSEAYNAALTEKYTYLRNEALKHTDPKQYIYDKYKNTTSPFYASDLTEIQRRISYENEMHMLKYGEINGVQFQDSLFGDTHIFGAAKDADDRIFDRRMINKQLANMFQNAGTKIPEETNLICTVDFTSCRISVSDETGDNVDRSELIHSIENAINKENNGIELYIHIMKSCSSMYRNESSQFNYEGWYKFCYLHNLGNTSFGMNGDYNKDFADWCNKYYPGEYAKKAEQVGYDGFNDMDLQIGLNSKGFYDVYQNVNWSEPRGDKIKEWYEKTEYSVLADIVDTKHLNR